MSRMRPRKDSPYKWPETGNADTKAEDIFVKIPPSYGTITPDKDNYEARPVCYPGTTLSQPSLTHAKELLEKQLNAIGCHTHGKLEDNGQLTFATGEGGFEVVQRLEREAIFMLASLFGADEYDIDGYFNGGGTEGNIMGLWIGREYLRKYPDPCHFGTVVLATPLRHYSIDKAVHLLDFGQHSNTGMCMYCNREHIFLPDHSGSGLQLVGMNDKGEMDIDCLNKVIEEKFAEGCRRFLITATVGTCLMGSIDPITEIGAFLKKKSKEHPIAFYLHVDASFAGFTVPFVNPDLKFGFDVPEVMSMTFDGDKMGRLPYPAGIFLCRKSLMEYVSRRINYVRGNVDDTLSGSRSCLAPVLAWFLWTSQGKEEQRRYVQQCLDNRDYLLKKIEDPRFKDIIKPMLPAPPWVNFAPMEICIDPDARAVPDVFSDPDMAAKIKDWTSKAFLEPFHLRSDNFPSTPADPNSCPRTVYKICVMPHNTPKTIDFFLDQLLLAHTHWQHRMVKMANQP